MKCFLAIAVALAFACSRASSASAGAFEELIHIADADSAVPSAVPRSESVLNEAWLRSLDPDIQRALRLLALTPTGHGIIAFAGDHRLPIVFGEVPGAVIDNRVIISREMLRDNPDVLLHEMEHIRQMISFGIHAGGIEVESGAMSIQGRAWAEAGGPRRPRRNSSEGEINAGQMQAWLKYPQTY